MANGAVKCSIRQKLADAFAPSHLDVIDDSELHRGHAGYREGGESHFRIVLVSRAFTGKTRLERQRLIHAVLAEELAGSVHAMSIHAGTPDETDEVL